MKLNCQLIAAAALLTVILTAALGSVADDKTPVPPLVRIAGTLRNASGEPLSGLVGVTFLIYKDEEGGAPMWMESQNVRADSAGRYSVILGSQHAHGIPPDLFASGEACWLGVTPESSPELPRVLLATVPYAMKAADAETLGGRPASAYLLAPDTQPTQLTAVAPSLPGSFAGKTGWAVPNSVDPGVPGTLAKYLTATSIGPSLITDNGSALGVRLSDPEQVLDILGRAQYRTEGIYTAGFFLRGSDTGPLVFVGQSGPNSSDPFAIWHSGAWRMTIDNQGRVGVGTTPEFRFDVSGRIRLRAQDQESAGLWLGPAGEMPTAFIGQTGTDRLDPIAFWHNGNWRLVVNSSGYIGIGTTTPSALLDVAGELRISSSGSLTFPDGTAMNTAARSFVLSAGDSSISVTPSGSGASVKVNNSGITSTHLAANAVTNSAIANAAITSSKLASAAVTSTAIGDGAITSAKLAPGAVTNSTIADGAITGSKIAAGAISPSAVTGTAAILGSNSFSGDQTLRGGLFARNYSTTGTSQALQGRTDSTSGIAVQAITGSTTGNTVALNATNPSSSGTAVLAEATSATGSTIGVKATTAGAGGSAAIHGIASAKYSTDPTYGVRAEAASQYGIGVLGYASSLTGATKGVSGKVESASGIAGEFNNYAGGVILAGYNNTNRVFRLDGTGALWIDGVLHTGGGADFAEMVAITGDRSLYTPGDVLVIAQQSDRSLALSSEPYSTAVAGIYSTRPGLLGSQHSQNVEQSRDEIPLAVIGIVPCKATAENGPIHRGDLLVTSSLPGHVMKGTERSRMLGAVVGKALSPLETGTGTIEILVTLQ